MQDQGRYSVCGEIASGATATVFLAEDRVLRRKVALKKLHPHLLNHSETVKRFQKEAVAIASLSHENIIQVYDYGNEDHNLYLAMEYVDGASLESLLAGPPRVLPNLAALSILRQLMLGLDAAHAASIIHRDVKPSNVLVDRKGCVRIADFGIAFLEEENSITKTGSYLGTPVYSSPEQANGQTATNKTDIFSSGILFYRCFTGRLPFQGENSHMILKAILESQPRKPAALNRRLFPGLSELTMAMLSKSPDKRPSARECVAELEAVAARFGFEPDQDRVRRLLPDPAGYAETECVEIGARFLGLAKAEREAGSDRKAMKLIAQAELYSKPATEAQSDQAAFAQDGSAARVRRAVLALSALVVAGALAGGLTWYRSKPQAVSPVAGTAAVRPPVPEAPASGAAKLQVVPASANLEIPKIPKPAPDARTSAIPLGQGAGSGVSPQVRRSASARQAVPKRPPRETAKPALVAAVVPAVEKALPGFLLVKSNPPFASATIDGRDAGHTPFKAPVELASGDHEITLEREGCLPLKTTFRVEPGETRTLRLTLEKSAAASR